MYKFTLIPTHARDETVHGTGASVLQACVDLIEQIRIHFYDEESMNAVQPAYAAEILLAMQDCVEQLDSEDVTRHSRRDFSDDASNFDLVLELC
jgi:hypothetical protein